MTSGIDGSSTGSPPAPGGSGKPQPVVGEDRTWCVATEIDFCWTYVAGSQACVDALLDHPGLEALPTQPGHRGDIDSDTINANG